jgi:anti-sigma factor RsiW
MNCRGWNPHLALYVEGDLEQDLAQQLEAHLAVCDECREFADTLRETQVTFRQVRNDIIETASLDRIRAKVLRQVRAIEERRGWIDRLGMLLWSGWSWRYSVLGCVALVVVSAVVWRLTRVAGPIESQPRVVASPKPEQAVRPEEAVSAVAESRPAITKPRQVIAAAPGEPADVAEAVPVPEPIPFEAVTEEQSKDNVVQLFTEDPNIVIYWLIDPNGGY